MRALKELYIILQRELQTISLIKEVEKMKNNLLIKGKLVDLSNINNDLTKLIEESQKIEEKRENVIEEIKKEEKITSSRLKDIISIIKDEELKKDFNELYENLKKEVNEVKYYSSINNELIKASLEVIEITLKRNELDMSDIDYTAKEKNNFSILINKII